MKLLKDLYFAGMKVFLRADLDVPTDNIKSEETATRLTNLKPTVDYLLQNGVGKVVIAGHIGRPTKEIRDVEAGIEKPPLYSAMMTTEQLVEPITKILGRKVVFCPDFGHMTDDKIILFENLRFWLGEGTNDQVFANKLAILGQVYVNEAFGNCHRAHSSMVKLPGILPHAAGLHLEKEVEEFKKLVEMPQHPFVAIVGGAKSETKIPVIENLSRIADKVLVGGALLKEIPVDGSQFAVFGNVVVGALTSDGEDMDDASVVKFVQALEGAKTVIWNGPLGHFEKGFDKGSKAVVEAVTKGGIYSVVGGGETTKFLAQAGYLDKFSFVSSGGGAMLEFLAGKELPGIKALE